MTVEHGLAAIRHCIRDPKTELFIKNGEVGVRKKSFFSFTSYHDSLLLAQFIHENQATINAIFREAYEAGYVGRKFQAQIDRIERKAHLGLPNFLKQYTSNWMGNARVQNKKATEILFPGTHDSGASKVLFNRTPAFAMGFAERTVFFLAGLPVLGSFIAHFFHDWTTNQKHTIDEQLANGIRLFDFRLGKDNTGELFLSHRYLVERFANALEQIQKFLAAHPQEVIVINLKVEFDYRPMMTLEDKQRAVNLILAYLKDYLGKNNFSDVSIRQLVEKGERIQLHLDFGDDFQLDDSLSALIHRKGSEEIWPNREAIDEVLPSIQDQINSEKERPSSAAFIYPSLNTTPGGLAIAQGIFSGSNLKKMGKEIQRQKLDAFIDMAKSERRADHTRIINGVIFDRPKGSTVNRIIRENLLDDEPESLSPHL